MTEQSWVKATYNIKGEYTNLSGKIVTIDDCYNKTDFDITVEINGDGKLLNKYSILPSNKAKTVDVDVSDVKKTRNIRLRQQGSMRRNISRTGQFQAVEAGTAHQRYRSNNEQGNEPCDNH